MTSLTKIFTGCDRYELAWGLQKINNVYDISKDYYANGLIPEMVWDYH